MTRDDDRVPPWRRYLRFWRGDSKRDVNDELAFHLESTIDEYVAAGMTRAEAREAARRKFGDVDGISQTLYTLSEQRERTMARTEWLDTLRQDFVYGLRQLRRSPAFTTVAVLTLALGIGANSAIFSVVYSVLLRPLPYANAERIVRINQRDGKDVKPDIPFGNYERWRRETPAFESVGAYWFNSAQTLTGRGDPVPVQTIAASASYWTTMFIPPVVGRYFTADEDREGAPPVVVLSHALWQSRFNGDRDVVGKNITLNGRARMVVGVAPSEYVLRPPAEQLWVPLAVPASRLADFSDHELSVFGLLKTGESPDVARRQVERIEGVLAKENPRSGYDGSVVLEPLADDLLGPHRARLYMLLGAVGLVLLIACGNIANLLLARATVRRGEIAIRGALGATRARIVAQLLVESLLLAFGGAALGLVVARVAMQFLVSAPAQIPRLQNTTLNVPVVMFTLGLAVVCAIVFGLIPAWRASKLDLQQTLRDGGRASRTAARERLRRVLVVSELCVAQVLLIGAGLLIRSSMRLESVPVGFDTHNLLVMSMVLPASRYANDGAREAGFQQIESAIAAVPGVRSVGRTQTAPIYGFGWNWSAQREGSNGHDDGAVDSHMRFVSPAYFSTLGLRLLRGRDFTRGDGPEGLRVAIVSRGLARRLYGEADPIGRRISNSGGKDWLEIVGVVDDMRARGLRQDPPRELYMPASQRVNGSQTLLVRSGIPPQALVPEIRRAVGTVDPLLAISNISTMDQALARTMAMDRFTKWLLVALGGTGLVLAIVGVYGVVSFFVTQRTHEMGVRLALGASTSGVRWLVVKQGALLAAGGVALGALLALGSSRLLESLLFGITTHDPATYLAVSGVLGTVTVLASYLPARRATRIDPLSALRSG